MCQKGKEAAAAANYPKIRLLLIPKTAAKKPAKDVNSQWVRCQPDTVVAEAGAASPARCIYFGLRLHKDLDVPIGLIESAWGGSAIEPWTIPGDKNGIERRQYTRHDCPRQAAAHSRRDLVPGRDERLRKEPAEVFRQDEGPRRGLAEGMGLRFPLLFRSDSPYNGYPDGELPALWEAQVESLKIPKTGMAVTTDLVSNLGDIHPINKLDVGNRLAPGRGQGIRQEGRGLLGAAQQVDEDRGRQHPAFVRPCRRPEVARRRALSEFKIAAADGKFVPAVATIDGETVVVEANGLASPTQVQFGWHHRANPNLANGAGLPASPFQTNNWQGGTGE